MKSKEKGKRDRLAEGFLSDQILWCPQSPIVKMADI